MEKFFEKLKDGLYDNVDNIMIILVIFIVALIINWRLGGLFSNDINKIISQDPPDIVDYKETPLDSHESYDDKNSLDEGEVENEEEENEFVKTVAIHIPSGSMPAKIGDILVSNGLVDDSNEFIRKAVELNVDTKLRSGDFRIESDCSLEEILSIITK